MLPLTDAELATLRPWLLRQARRLAGDPDLAEDLAQECLEVLLRQGDGLRAPQARRAWCRTVLRNCFRQHLRRAAFRCQTPTAALPECSADPWREVDGRLAAEALLSALDEPRRTVTRAFYLGAATIRQLATDTGRPEGTIKRWLMESREAMQMAAKPGGKAHPKAYVYGTNWLDDARTALDRALRAAGYRPSWPRPTDAKLPEGAALFVFGEMSGERSGLELLLTVRATPALARTPVLLFGPGRESAVLAAWQAGADAYLTSPGGDDLPEFLVKLRQATAPPEAEE